MLTHAIPILTSLGGGSAAIAALVFGRRVLERRKTPAPPTPRALLRRALGRHEVEVHYQPVFLADGALAGAEALVRWRHPSSGLIGPGALLRGVESGHELDALTTLVLSDAARTLARLRRSIGTVTYLGVNVPAALLEHERLPQMVEAQLRGAGTDGVGLVLELTETSEVRNWEAVKLAIHRLRPLGVQLALDDFGRGHANLPALGISEADIVKLDKSLIDEVLINERSREIVESVVQLAASLKMQVVAEGIEDAEILDWLRGRSIMFFQGHVLGCPQPIDELLAGRYRGVPLPALSRFPHSQRGSVTIPALFTVLATVGSLAASGVGFAQWNSARSESARTTRAHDELAHAYTELTNVVRQSRTSQVGATGEFRLEVGNVFISTPAWRMLDAVERMQALEHRSGNLANANAVAHLASGEIARGNRDGAARLLIEDVAPLVHFYLREVAADSSTMVGSADRVDRLADLCFDRMATLTAARFRAGLTSYGSDIANFYPQPSPSAGDPIAAWLIEAQNDPAISSEFLATVEAPLASIASTWPALTDGSVDALAAIELPRVQGDILTVQISVQEALATHSLPGLGAPEHPSEGAPEWVWLIAAIMPLAIGTIALGALLVATGSRGKNPLVG